MVLLVGLRLIAVAIPIGLGGGFILAGAMSSLLFGIQPLDPVTFAGAAILLAVVALLATLVPAMRATRIDP